MKEEALVTGTGVDCTIRELAQRKPDGMPRKLLDVSRLTALGWQASIALEDGLRDAYAWYVANQGSARLV